MYMCAIVHYLLLALRVVIDACLAAYCSVIYPPLALCPFLFNAPVACRARPERSRRPMALHDRLTPRAIALGHLVNLFATHRELPLGSRQELAFILIEQVSGSGGAHSVIEQGLHQLRAALVAMPPALGKMRMIAGRRRALPQVFVDVD